jgi:hypothetical protein
MSSELVAVDVVEYGSRRWIIVVGVMPATLMQTLDGTITNVALPTIQGNFGASPEEATGLIQLNEIVRRQAIVLSFADANFTIAIMALPCILLILLMHKRSQEANLHRQQTGG